MAAKCRKFEPNVFNKTKCGVCFKSRNDHSASALESAKAARKLLQYGYLFIAPDVSARRWQRRFFVLYDDGELTYAVDENADTVPQGRIDMNLCEDVFDAEQLSGHEFSFGIVISPDTHYIKGTSREEVMRWMDLLMVYPTENALNKVNTKVVHVPQSFSQEAINAPSTGDNKERSPERLPPPHPSSDIRPPRNPVPNGNPILSSSRQRTKSSPQISQRENQSQPTALIPNPGDSDDELADKFLKEDWYKPINNNQSSLGNLNTQKMQRRHTELSIPSLDLQRRLSDASLTSSENKPSLSSRIVSTGSLNDKSRLVTSNRRKTQPEIRYAESSDDSNIPDISSLGRRRSSTDRPREVTVLGGRDPTDGTSGPPAEKRRSRTTEVKVETLGETDESKLAKAMQEIQSRTSQGSTDSENQGYTKKGWLHKLTPTAEWSKHWFVLCGQALKYYRDSRAEEINDLDGRIDLKYCVEIREVDASKNYGLQITNRNGTYTLSAMTSGIRSNWIHAISNCVNDEAQSESHKRNGGKPQLQRRNTVPEVRIADNSLAELVSIEDPGPGSSGGRHGLERVDSNASSTYKDRSQLVVEGRAEDATSTKHDSVAEEITDRSAKTANPDHLLLVKREQDPKLSGKSPIEKKLDKLRSKVVPRARSPPPRLASEVLKKAAESPDHGAVVHMLESEVDHLQTQLEKAHDEMVALHDENSKLKSKFKHAKKKIKEAEESSHQLSSHTNLEDQIRDLEAQNATSNNEKSLLKLELENVRQENDITHVKIRKLTEENGTLKRSFQSATNENSGIRSEMKQLQSQMAKLQEANIGKHDELTELVQRVDEYRNESRKHKKTCREKESQILEISEELQHKCEDYEDLTRKYNLMVNEMDKNKNLKASSLKLERENTSLKQDIDQKTQDYSDVMNRYNQLASEYQNLKSSLEGNKKITSNYVSNLKDHETLIKNLRQELENRNMDLTTSEKRRAELEVELKDAKMTLKDSLHILDSQKSRVDEKDKQILELKKYLEERGHEHDEMVNKYEDLLSKYNALVKTSETGDADQKDEISKLNNLLDEKMHDYHELQDKYNDLLCDFEKVHNLSLFEQLEDELNDRTDDCEELALRVDQLEKELANTRMTLLEQESGKPDMVDFGCSPAADTAVSHGDGVSVSVQVVPEDVMDLCTSACQTFFDLDTKSASSCHACPPACSLDPISPTLTQTLKKQLHQSERRCDELDVRNSALKLQINQMMDRYNEEVKFYSAKIDDLVLKLRAEQEKRKENNGVEAMLTGLEKQIEEAEKVIQMQGSAEETLVQGLSEMLADEGSDTNSDRSMSPDLEAEKTGKPETKMAEQEVREPQAEEKYDDELLTRIQSLHNRVVGSNRKLTELFAMINSRDDESESLSSVEINGKLRCFQQRLSSIQGEIRAHETRTATTESLKTLMKDHDRTLRVLDECETGLMTSLSSLNRTEQRRDKLQALVRTVNEMMEFAGKERESILANKRQIEEALNPDQRLVKEMEQAREYVENVTSKSPMGARIDTADGRQEDFVRERDQYFRDLQVATQRIGELEETVDYLRKNYARNKRSDVLLHLSDAVETYANVIAEGIVHHSLVEVSRGAQLKDRFCEGERFSREMKAANNKIRELENTVEFQLSDREKLVRAESFNHYASLITQQSEHNDSMFKDYQENINDIRHQQLNEFAQFRDRLKSIEDKIGTMILCSVGEFPAIEAPSGEINENWSAFSQAACLVMKAMCQAELVLKLHQLRDTILACSSRHDQLRLFNQEIDLSFSRLRSREKLMTDNVDKYKSEKLENVSFLIVKYGLKDFSLSQTLRALIDKLNQLVNELASFYKSMDMVGDQADLQKKLDACIYKELELANMELEQNCQGKRGPDKKTEPMTQEGLSSLLYNLADLLAQRSMLEAQFQYVSEQHQKNKNFILPVTKEESKPSSSHSVRTDGVGAQPVIEAWPISSESIVNTHSLPLPKSDRRHSDVLETSAVCLSPAARSPTTTSSDTSSSNESETDSETESDVDSNENAKDEVKIVTEMKIDLRPIESMEMIPSGQRLEVGQAPAVTDGLEIGRVPDILDSVEPDNQEVEMDDSVFSAPGDELNHDLNTRDVFQFFHKPNFASSLRDPDVDHYFHGDDRPDRTVSESDVINTEASFQVVGYSGNVRLSTSALNLETFTDNTHSTSDYNSSKSLPHTQHSAYKTTLASRMRMAEAKNKLHRSPAFRRRQRPSETSDSAPDLSTDLGILARTSGSPAGGYISPVEGHTASANSKPNPSPSAKPPSRQTVRRISTPDVSRRKSQCSLPRRGSTPENGAKSPVRIPHSETRKVYVKSLRKPPPLKRGSPPKLTSPKKPEDRFVVSFGLSRGPVPEPSNNIF